MDGYQLAQINVGRLRAPVDSPLVAEFMAALDPINALAEASPGFVWRFQTEDGNATAVRPVRRRQHPRQPVGVGVGRGARRLRLPAPHHASYLRRRREWFERMTDVDRRAVVGAGRAPSRRSRRASTASTTCGPTARRPTRSRSASASRAPVAAVSG